jgi:mannose-6-phosphate isomerase
VVNNFFDNYQSAMICDPLPALPLDPNPVWRSYLGGRVLRAFRGKPDTADNHFPEDWLASTVAARNGPYAQGPDEGISSIPWNGRKVTVTKLLTMEPEKAWGNLYRGKKPSPTLGVLIKLLDASARLQVQAHPDRQFVRRHLSGDAGKTECWYILSTRGPAQVYLGFQRPPERAEWKRLMQEQDVGGMLACFDPISVQTGDCLVIPAGVPHAIGAGIFMIELQEPSDWVVRCEARNGDLVLPDEQRYMGLGLDACLDIFDYRAYSVEAVRDRFQQRPRVRISTETFTEEEIIEPNYQGFFRLRRLCGTGPGCWQGDEIMVMIVTRGEGILCSAKSEQPVRQGQTWLLLGCVAEWRWEAVSGDWEVLLAQPPIQE